MRTLLAVLFASGLSVTLGIGCSDDGKGEAPTDVSADEGDVTPDISDEADVTPDVSPDGDETCTPGEGSIAILLPALEERWELDDRRLLEEALDEAGVEYSVVNAQGSPETQVSQAETALAGGAKVLVLIYIDASSAADIHELARDAGAYVIDYDRLTNVGPGADLYVSFDNVAVGRIMGETLEPAIDGLGLEQPGIVFLNGWSGDYNAVLFATGYHEIADPRIEAGDWVLVGEEEVVFWDPAEADRLFRQILSEADHDIDAVFAANDGIAMAVVHVLKDEGLEPTLLSGQDATVPGLQHILSGWQTMTVYKPIRLEAEAAAEAAVALLNCVDVSTLTDDTINNGQNDIPYIKLTGVAVTAENIADTVIADGFRTWEEICVGEYAQYCPE